MFGFFISKSRALACHAGAFRKPQQDASGIPVPEVLLTPASRVLSSGLGLSEAGTLAVGLTSTHSCFARGHSPWAPGLLNQESRDRGGTQGCSG